MKIFNWVQRRFTHKDGLAQNTKQSGLIINADDQATYDKQFLHDQENAFPNMFDGWKGGLLAIGTFGYGPLKDDEIKQNEEPGIESLENEQVITDSEDEDEDEEVNPLVFAAYEHDYVGLLEMKMGGSDELKKERTTLAQLFSADSKELVKIKKEEIMVKENKRNNNKHGFSLAKKLKELVKIKKEEIMVKENKRNNNKHGFSLAKKLIGDQEAIHKLHRMVRRMMKRKIHPDEGVEKQNTNTVDSSRVVLKKCQTTTESASLLSTQVADAFI